jgi:hypothetical protein
MHTLTLTDDELEFLTQLFNSDIAVTIKTVEIVADLRKKVMGAAHRSAAHGTPQQSPQKGAEAV